MRIAQGLAFVAREFYTGMPFTRLGNPTFNQFHHDVHGGTIGYIAGQEGTYSITIGYLALAITMDLDGTVNIQSITEHRLLSHRINTQLLVLLYNQIHLFFFYPAINTQSAEGHGHTLGKIIEEHFIAKAIVKRREVSPITTTKDLAAIVEKALGPGAHARKHHPATRVFQALRMKVNHELESVQAAIDAILPRLKPGGRLAVITFESISDRLVKHIFQDHVGKEVSLQQGGSEWQGIEPRVRKTDRHAVIPTIEEVNLNPRSRSAKLRVVVKL